jgi:hypothetical protein
MWTYTPESRQLITEVSKELVAEIAPEELQLADELLEDYYANPEVHQAKDSPLGFGSEYLAASTPVIAMALQAVFTFVLNEVWGAAQKEGAVLIAERMRALFHPRKDKKEPSLGLNLEQLEKVKQLVKKEALRGGMSSKKAEDLALRIAARIALTG